MNINIRKKNNFNFNFETKRTHTYRFECYKYIYVYSQHSACHQINTLRFILKQLHMNSVMTFNRYAFEKYCIQYALLLSYLYCCFF